MLDFLAHLFAAVCGQNPDHTWAPGGLLLPCCQRCTGLYAGAGVAALLHLWLRPKLTGRFLEIHGAFLLLMVPFGFHWVPQGPALRTAAGVLFGFGVVTYLMLPLKGERKRGTETSNIQHRTSNIQCPPGGSSLDVGCSMLDAGCFRSSFSRCYFLLLGAVLLCLPAVASLGGRFTAYSLSALIAWGGLALFALVAADLTLAVFCVLRRLRRLASPRVPA
jgi:uncharacterized membrane protein